MADQPFMLVSLEEAKAKRLAQVLNNETCTKILNWLSTHKEGTESEIAKKLKLPLSTVHYNLKQLVEAKLVLADEYHYSEKGREVNHYKLANKYIIIAPSEDQSTFMDKLKQFIPAALIVAGVGVVLKAMSLLTGTFGKAGASMDLAAAPKVADFVQTESIAAEEAGSAMARTFADSGADRGVMLANEVVNDSINSTVNASTNIPCTPSQGIVEGGCVINEQVIHPLFSNGLIWAFVVGGLFAIFLIALLTYLRKRKK